MKSVADEEAWPGEQSELWLNVSNSAVSNSQALQTLLDEELDEEVRNAILQILDLMAEGYSNALSNIK